MEEVANDLMKRIDDNYIQDNMDDIIKLMILANPEKVAKGGVGNWRRAMKKEGVSNNLTYMSLALAHKSCKLIEARNRKTDNFYEREAAFEERMKNEAPLLERYKSYDDSAKKIFREFEDKIRENFEGDREDGIYDRDSFRQYLRSKYGSHYF